jgi:magnesium-transporting ATPase (P-type)
VSTGRKIQIKKTYFWAQIMWHDIKVGDLLKVKRDDAVPADIVLL